jgi:hypothetical protein
VNDAVDAYLIDLTVPERGLRCLATEEPGVATATPPRETGPYVFG